MRTKIVTKSNLPLAAPCPAPEVFVPDDTPFRLLLGKAAWNRLAPAIRARFSQHLEPHESVTYQGVIVETRMSLSGWLIAQLARLVGAPLPLEQNNGATAAVVTVTEMPPDAHGCGGQFWTRVYGRAGHFPQIISSVKRFTGPTGLEEQVCGGMAMALTLKAERDTLSFISTEYFITLAGLRLKLPRFLAPGELKVIHEDIGRGWFCFILTIIHPLVGEILYQKSVFTDPVPATDKEAPNG